jgi:hypothetical protein
VGVLENEADGPMALLLTVLTAPEMVARLLCTLATGPLSLTDMDMDGAAEEADFALALGATLADDVVVWGNVTWMRISSHWAPIHSSYRLLKAPLLHCHHWVVPPMASEPLLQMEKPPV